MSIWIDTDMGTDDLAAILVIQQHSEVAGLSLSFGCTELAQVERNAAGAAAAFGWRFPITTGAARPLLGPVETAQRILGPTGMLARGARLPDVAPDHSDTQASLIGHFETSGPVFALGPLTNLAIGILARPDLTPAHIVWMGGSTGRGNHSPYAEYNALADPLALAILLDRGVRVDMIDLEACRKVLIEEHHVARIAESGRANAALLASLMGGYLDIALTRGRSAMALYDPVAAVAVVRPELFDMTAVRLSVDLGDTETRAQTRVVDGPPNARIIRDLDAAAVRETVLAALESA